MPTPATNQLEAPANRDGGVKNGHAPAQVSPRTASYSALSTLTELPGHATILGADSTGEQLGRLFSGQPELPGVILFEQDRFVGVISQAHFYKCISRAFGREIY